ncbi:MAG: hypothetical protein K2W82_07175 [Candidatus Obscuribacterales bacterium]|nr:hypothetical protein [Candidatus Obscuribacterales bacterium]
MESQRAQFSEDKSGVANSGIHEESVTVQGLDDLFEWASEMVAEGLDGRARKARDQRVKRQILNIIHRNADLQAKSKHVDEVTYLQRRAMALQNSLVEKLEEITMLRQIMLGQYYSLQRIPELEEKVSQLESMTWYREEAEEERKQLMTALSKLKKERDYLEDLVIVNEIENSRLSKLLAESKSEVEKLKSRRWWHCFFVR